MRFATTLATAVLLATAVASPARAEEPTPQAINANAEFLAYAGPPVREGKVCVVDTGVDLSTDAAPNVVARYSLYPGTLGDVGGSNIAKHGTYVASVIASQLDGQATVGTWPRAKVVSVRVFPDGNSGTSVSAYIDALDRCAEQGATVVSLSLSGLGTATGAELGQLENRISDMRDNERVDVVAAAGNTGGQVGYPGAFPAAFTVAANDAGGNFCSFSARGPEVDISTLGCSVLVSMENDGVGLASGTSYSTPIVSAVLAALRAYSPTPLSPAAAEKLLAEHAQTAPAGKVLDVATAFRAAGLGAVAATPRPAAPTAPAVVPGPVPTIQYIEAPGATRTDSLAEIGVQKPRVRSSSYRRGVLSVVVSGVPDFGRALFTVDGRSYARASGKLRLKLRRAPKRVSVLIDVPEVGPTSPVRIELHTTNARRGER
ncbi:MAG: serine protease [Solirubrobacteraceae bacterium]|nr:serine protease [Solirubrobacteraceae bacterium]